MCTLGWVAYEREGAGRDGFTSPSHKQHCVCIVFGVSGVLEDTHGTLLYSYKLEHHQVGFSKFLSSFASLSRV
jgi:hypothetical protein